VSSAFDYAAATQRILDTYDAADDETRRLGAAWYPNARRMALAMVPNGSADDARAACGVVAALSPRCGWAQNLAWAAKVLAAKRNRKACPEVHTRAMRAQAWRIAGGEYPLDVLNGPKVRAFYCNLTGGYDAVTVDVWAARVAFGRLDIPGPGNRYAEIARAYMDAANCRLTRPAIMQATTWIQIRGKAD
jgi:hypothetical protein